MTTQSKRGRPVIFRDDLRVRICAKGGSRLQSASDRRAIVEFLLDVGGSATLKEIDDHFGFSVRDKTRALIRSGWLEIAP